MIGAGLVGAGLAAGLWLIVRALVPSSRPLRVLSDELLTPRVAREPVDADDPIGSRWARLALRVAGAPSPRRQADLAVAGRTPARQTLDQLGYATAFATLVVLALIALPVGGVAVPALPGLAAVVLAATAGWAYPAIELRSRARAARRSWAQTLTVYVDIVGISLAGGAGVDDALMTSAVAGTGPQFRELADTLRTARTRRQPLWVAMDELGGRGDIPALRELAASVELAAEAGTRIRETLIAKSGAMRIRQLTEIEAEAEAASETMGVAPALMAVAAVVLIGYPALARFFEG